MAIDLSVVIPVRNEEENVVPLLTEIRAALDGLMPYEVIFVDDGSDDGTVEALTGSDRGVADAEPGFAGLRVLRHETSCGQSTAVHSGVTAARGAWIATLDGDGQNDPADIPALWKALTEATDRPRLKMLAGHRAKRQDSRVKKVTSRVANRVRAGLLRDDTPDTGCGLKLFERALFLSMPYFDHMHRFLPALTQRQGFEVESVRVNHRPRTAGRSKYGTFNRLWVGIVDLLGVMWLQRRARIPSYLPELGSRES